jgi:hypothetical protein
MGASRKQGIWSWPSPARARRSRNNRAWLSNIAPSRCEIEYSGHRVLSPAWLANRSGVPTREIPDNDSGNVQISSVSCRFVLDQILPFDMLITILEPVAWLHDNIRGSSRRTHAPELFPQRECDGALRRWEAPLRLSMQARHGNVARLRRK